MRSRLLSISVWLLPALLGACQPSIAQDAAAPTQSQEASASAASGEAQATASAAATAPATVSTSMASMAAASSPTASESAAAPQAPQPAALKLKILERYPHDSGAFTQGLQWLDKRFLESTGMVGQSGVRWVSPKTGEVEQQVATPAAAAFGEGVTALNGQIYHITWQTGEAYRFDTALKLQETYGYTGEGWGITNDGKELIMSDGSATLFFRDPKTFAVTRQISVTDAGGQAVTQLNELEWADGAIWANIWQTNRIARIDPQTGAVTGWLDISDLTAEATLTAASFGQRFTADDVANGIAYNEKTGHFYLTGKRWPVLFEVEVSE